MRIIITGGNGFLGSSLLRKLLSLGHTLLVFSKNSNNITDTLSTITFIKASNKDLSLFKEDIEKFAPDLVIHAGWGGGNSYKDINELLQFEENIEPSISFLQVLSNLPTKPKFIGFGSFAEYGRQLEVVTELTNPEPINLYGLSKLVFKNYSELLCGLWGMDWLWIRPCYVYGPGDVQSRLIPYLVKKFVNNENVVLDDCESIVDYMYIDDFVEQTVALIEGNSKGVFNLCSGKQYKIKHIVLSIHDLLESRSLIDFDRSINRVSVSSFVCGNPKKTLTKTGLALKIGLEDGLEKTTKFYRDLYEKLSNN